MSRFDESSLEYESVRTVVNTMCGIVSVRIGTAHSLVAAATFVAVTFEDLKGETLTIGLTHNQAAKLKADLP